MIMIRIVQSQVVKKVLLVLIFYIELCALKENVFLYFCGFVLLVISVTVRRCLAVDITDTS